MMKIRDIVQCLESVAPLSLQEAYDNSGLITGSPDKETKSALVTIDVTEKVVDEAIKLDAGLIIAHHPVIFQGLKKITGRNDVERTILKAIRNDIAIYAAHTNFDTILGGVSSKMAEKLNLVNCRTLDAGKGHLRKLVTYVPQHHEDKVREAIWSAGAGNIGNYDSCSFNTAGKGTFRGNMDSNPFAGERGKIHFEDETRIETIFPFWMQDEIVRKLKNAHPYEEVAYDIYPLVNSFEKTGMGIIGELQNPVDEIEFLAQIKSVFNCKSIRHTFPRGTKVGKVAVCGGAGSFLIDKAISAKADFFITGDIKYHQFFEAENKLVIADIGHFESEQFTKELFYELVTKKFPTFAVHLSEVNTNPVFYF